MDKKFTPVIVGSPVGSIAITASKSQLKPQILVCDPEKPVSFFEPPENNIAIKFFNSDDILLDCHTLVDDQLPMSQRSYGWYNKFSKHNIYKQR